MRRLVVIVMLLLGATVATPAPIYAHGGIVDVTPADLWAHWEWHPFIVIGIVAGWGLYERGLGHRGVRQHSWQVVAFLAGLFALALALLSPLSALSGALFTAHMVQHLVLVLIAAPLLVLSRPLLPILWGLPQRGRRGVAVVARQKSLRAIWRILTNPVIAAALHLALLWLWHLPALYDAALADGWIHELEHASFFLSAALYWWVLGQQRHAGINVLSLFGMAMGSAALGLLLTLTRTAWYAGHVPYVATWGLTPLTDQQLAGLIMWIPGGVVYVIAAATLLGRWLDGIGRQVARRDQQVELPNG